MTESARSLQSAQRDAASTGPSSGAAKGVGRHHDMARSTATVQQPAGATNAPSSLPATFDPTAFSTNLAQVYENTLLLWANALERNSGTPSGPALGTEVAGVGAVLTSLAQHWTQDPTRFATAQAELFGAYLDIWAQQTKKLMGEQTRPVAKPEPGDKRFADHDWDDNVYFDSLKQFYLVSSRWLDELVNETEGLDPATRKRAEFFLKQLVSATSPSNFAFSNPEVVRQTLASNAQNLVQGMTQLMEDFERSNDTLRISQTDTTAFEVGRNLAITPGKVVFQNDLIQLIQYSPTTPQAYARPLLVVPPWINKFYILDLVPQKSFIKYAVDQGFTVFLISWVNPSERHAQMDWVSYMQDGILEAARQVRAATGEKQCNVLGYCVGGTLLGTTLAWLAQQKQDIFSSATFLTTQLDFSDPGELQVFVDEEQLATLQNLMTQHGYLDGSRMASAFNLLRPGDLIWPYVVNNYLLGKKPFPFDLLYWNQDSTRMAAANHLFYLTKYYKENALARGVLEFAGTQLDLSDVTVPVFELATKEDHIAPAKSVFTGARMLGSDVTFVLAGSGHIAGVVNPPEKMKYQYWTGDAVKNVASLDEWTASAREHAGSWWPFWTKWLAKHSGKKVAARDPEAGPLPVLQDAPGSFVLEKI